MAPFFCILSAEGLPGILLESAREKAAACWFEICYYESGSNNAHQPKQREWRERQS